MQKALDTIRELREKKTNGKRILEKGRVANEGYETKYFSCNIVYSIEEVLEEIDSKDKEALTHKLPKQRK